jgi:hypothetical protein
MNAVFLIPFMTLGIVWGFIGMITGLRATANIDKLQTMEHHQQVEITTLKAELAKLGVSAK